jgi:L-threonylcarbamoyladenylate synthase
MTAEAIMLDPVNPERAFSRCRDVIAAGGVIVYPTDTFYGLGVDPANAAALERLFEIKGRALDQPILLLIPGRSEVEKWAATVAPEAERLMKTHWPGALTLVLPARPEVSPLITAGRGTIGLRVPGNEITRRLLAAVGHALTGTSANVSGQASPRTAAEALASLAGKVDLVLDGGTAAGGLPSTIAEIRDNRSFVIREGAVRL